MRGQRIGCALLLATGVLFAATAGANTANAYNAGVVAGAVEACKPSSFP